MLKLTLIFLIGIAYAAQTRIKIGSKSWGYQIDLNHGQQIRNEFSNEDGITTGYYLFRNNDNQTKKLQYTIDPNRLQPDVEFDVINVVDENEYDNRSECLRPNSNLTFDSIDSNEDFKGHVTLKVGNSTYSINFATGDKSNSREEILTPTGLLYGRYNFMPKNSPNKIVINYKFNSTSVDPTFEVSLFKSSSETLETLGRHIDHYRERDYLNNINYNPNINYRAPYQRGYVPATSSGTSSSSAAGVSSSSALASHRAAAIARAQEQARQAALAEKYRKNNNNNNNHAHYHHHDYLSSTTTIPSWYSNRSKSIEP